VRVAKRFLCVKEIVRPAAKAKILDRGRSAERVGPDVIELELPAALAAAAVG
jgi:hypothetical protein